MTTAASRVPRPKMVTLQLSLVAQCVRNNQRLRRELAEAQQEASVWRAKYEAMMEDASA